jgi:hypothetical protein
MENDRTMSDLSLSRKECPKCGATWINGQHIWGGTGNTGNELDLASLVCNRLGNEQCINPSKGIDGGQTWEYRAGFIDGKIEERRKMMEQLRDTMGDV